MKLVNSYDRKTGDPISWHECCKDSSGELLELVEIGRRIPDCDHMFTCKCRTVITLQCPKCKKTCTESI